MFGSIHFYLQKKLYWLQVATATDTGFFFCFFCFKVTLWGQLSCVDQQLPPLSEGKGIFGIHSNVELQRLCWSVTEGVGLNLKETPTLQTPNDIRETQRLSSRI